MRIAILLSFNEAAAVRLLNHLARENAIILEAHPDLPLLYDSGVVYRRETDEHWSDYVNLLAQGWEDCDSLAAARAGELLARGGKALRRGDGGYAEGRKLPRIHAEVFLRTRARPEQPGLYHCLVRYRVGSRWFYDDPSARLGMLGRPMSGPEVARRLASQRSAS